MALLLRAALRGARAERVEADVQRFAETLWSLQYSRAPSFIGLSVPTHCIVPSMFTNDAAALTGGCPSWPFIVIIPAKACTTGS